MHHTEEIDVYTDWTTKFFDGLAVDFWIRVAPPPSDAELAFLQEIFRGNELLDVACGAGRYTIPLAAAGYRMTGVDISGDFLRAARTSSLPIDWQQSDIRELGWRERFDGALCFGNSFAYFDREETKRFLRGVARALRTDAPFVVETAATAESLLPNLVRERTMDVGDIVFSSTNTYDVRRSRLDIRYTFRRGSVEETKSSHTWIFTSGEVVGMFTECGFEVEKICASATEEFALGAPRAIFVTRRTAAAL